ncbi:hypothetical protein niasHT_016607 [Heterodera trifolii]|uniref:Netrin n=1 Tax=Heterodera trifolii TaxID=157864 RepID=A0ABD2LK24_9BILA
MFTAHSRRCPFRQHFLIFLLFASLFFDYPSELAAQPDEKTPSVKPHHYKPSQSSCYDERTQPQRCVPDFINVAFNLEVEVTNTCGVRQPTRFCVQTGHIGKGQTSNVCDVCDARVPAFAHPASYLTDFNIKGNETWWQSETMAEGIQYPQTVNLTLNMHKRYDITYIRLKFASPRPESFVVYKKNRAEDDWIPWQYYSGSCRSTFKLQDKAPILPGNEAVAQCTREFSDISPLTGGDIAFSTLDGRPSAENFEESEVLQEWVAAEQIRISLVQMNTFGDEISGDGRVLRSYYYGISDFAVGGRCKCNGHADQCVKSTGRGEGQLVCDCQHNTAGVDCQQCAPFFVDRPWQPATSMEANECLPCNCNGLSNRCYFNAKLFENTGHGGYCIDCAGNTQVGVQVHSSDHAFHLQFHGPHCEHCFPDHWRRHGEHYCRPCQCDEIGSANTQCNEKGQCRCKPGVGGQFCDRCEHGFYDFGATGCKQLSFKNKCEMKLLLSKWLEQHTDNKKVIQQTTQQQNFSADQLDKLERKFAITKVPCASECAQLAMEIGLTEKQVEEWFDSRLLSLWQAFIAKFRQSTAAAGRPAKRVLANIVKKKSRVGMSSFFLPGLPFQIAQEVVEPSESELQSHRVNLARLLSLTIRIPLRRRQFLPEHCFAQSLPSHPWPKK